MSTKRSNLSPAWGLPFTAYQVTFDDEPFITRRRLQCPLFGILFSKIECDDSKRYAHTHRRPFVSMAYGGRGVAYVEQVYGNPEDLANTRTRGHKYWRPYVLRSHQAHKITSIQRRGVRTVVLAGFMHRTFYFWTPSGPVDYKDYAG